MNQKLVYYEYVETPKQIHPQGDQEANQQL
jgi:hypothetical protein